MYFICLVSHKMDIWCVQVPGNDTPSLVIAFTMKSIINGQLVSKLHVIELGAQPGERSA